MARRFVARVIDWLVVFTALIVLGFATNGLAPSLDAGDTALGGQSTFIGLSLGELIGGLIELGCVVFGYEYVMLRRTAALTVGKRLARLRVRETAVTQSGSPEGISRRASARRAAATFVVCYTPLAVAGWIINWVLIYMIGKSIQDLVAGTVVTTE
ncbi:MAG: hypothetical protein JWM93_1792 [Frankiales bacterium]|nr:hypothetical protein [Frankiales bacterium]